MNTLEQQCPFLLLLWLHAVFVCPKVSTVMGAIAVVARAMFPIFWSVKGGWNFSTLNPQSRSACTACTAGCVLSANRANVRCFWFAD
jgi:hypothetical protein